MVMKRIVSILLILCMAFAVSSCNISSFYDNQKKTKIDDGSGTEMKMQEPEEPENVFDFNTTKWDGCTEMSFKEMLEKGVPKVLDASNASIIAAVTMTEDWSESASLSVDADLTENCKAITYKVVASDSVVTMDIHFFVEYDKVKDVVVVKGAKGGIDSDTDEFGVDDALETLVEVKEFAEQ